MHVAHIITTRTLHIVVIYDDNVQGACMSILAFFIFVIVFPWTKQICKSRERLVQLEEEFGDTESRSRVRFLKGTIADPRQMKLKQEHVSDYENVNA